MKTYVGCGGDLFDQSDKDKGKKDRGLHLLIQAAMIYWKGGRLG